VDLMSIARCFGVLSVDTFVVLYVHARDAEKRLCRVRADWQRLV